MTSKQALNVKLLFCCNGGFWGNFGGRKFDDESWFWCVGDDDKASIVPPIDL